MVSDLNGSMFVLTLHSGSTLNVTLADGAMIPAGLQDGALVEVKGTIPDASMPQEFLAQRVKLQDDDEFDGSGHSENEDEGELWGALSFDGTVWSVRGTELMFSSDTRYRPDSLAAAAAISLSPSGRSNGVRFSSAVDATTKMKNAMMATTWPRKISHRSACDSTISESRSEPANRTATRMARIADSS